MSFRAFCRSATAPRLILREMVCAVLLFTAALPVAAVYAAAPASEPLRQFDFAPGPLTETLNRFVAETGVFVSADGALTQGKTSAAVRGSFTPAQALAQLLAGTGLQAVAQDNGAYALAPLSVDASGATLMQAVKVEANVERSAKSEGSGSYAPGPTVTATGLSLSPRDTPQSVSVITRERLDDQALRTVADALRHTAGVSVKAVDRGRNDLTVRGFAVNNFQFDGVPVASGNVGIETGSTLFYDRIEVVRGATGLLSGAGDPSAAVNLVRKHADSKVFAGTLSAEFGSWDHSTVTADLGTPLNASGTVRARLVGSFGEQDAFVDLEHRKDSALYGIVDADLAERTRLSVGASTQRVQRSGVYWGGLPYWFTDGSRTDWGRSKTTATRWNRWDTQEQTAFATLEHQFDNRWTLRATALHYRQNEKSNLLWPWGEPDRDTGLGMEAYPYLYVTEPRQNQGNVIATGPFSLFGREHELTAGLTYSRQRDGWLNGGEPLSPVDPMGNFHEWDGSYPKPVWGALELGSRGTTTQSGVYAAARFHVIDPLRVIAGARLSRWKRDEETAVWTGDGYTFKHSSVFTPYLGVLYDLGERVTAYASYTDIFKPQTYRDRNGKYLDPLEGKSYEAGLKSEFFEGRINASAAVFRIDQDNFAVNDGNEHVLDTPEQAYRASQGVKTKGYEAEINGDILRNWNLSLSWTHYSAKDADGVDVAETHPREMLKLFTHYELPGVLEGLSVGGGLDWQSRQPVYRENPYTGETEHLGENAYTLVNLMASYQFSEPLRLQVNVDNLLDRKYIENSWGTFTYGEPRRVLVSLDYRF